MIPADSMKKVEGGVEMTVLNLITTIPADQIPGDPIDIIDIKVNGKELSAEEKKNIKITLDGDKEIQFSNLRDAGSVPVNTKMVFFLPSDDINAGDEVTVEINVEMVAVNIEVTRTVQ
jgi:hypothetical protein